MNVDNIKRFTDETETTCVVCEGVWSQEGDGFLSRCCCI